MSLAAIVCAAVFSLSSCDDFKIGDRMGSFIYDIRYTVRAIRNRPPREKPAPSDAVETDTADTGAADRAADRHCRKEKSYGVLARLAIWKPLPIDTVYIEKSLPDTLSIPESDCLYIEARDSVVLTEASAALIVVDKEKMELSVLDFASDTIMVCPIGCGHQYGNKRNADDDRTPEGVFKVRRIENSSEWCHMTRTGLSEFGVYGPKFIRLELPPKHSVGIHGTNSPGSLGKRESEGCIRVSNQNIVRLAELAYPGMPVLILPSSQDTEANCESLGKD